MAPAEALDVTRIYSVAGMLPSDTPLIRHRPFRAPHHTVSNAGLVGGGQWPRPGEISLAHRGVLFLDELPELGQHGLEVLRQPLEDKIVTISGAQGSLTFPANFMLVGAMSASTSRPACTRTPSRSPGRPSSAEPLASFLMNSSTTCGGVFCRANWLSSPALRMLRPICPKHAYLDYADACQKERNTLSCFIR